MFPTAFYCNIRRRDLETFHFLNNKYFCKPNECQSKFILFTVFSTKEAHEPHQI